MKMTSIYVWLMILQTGPQQNYDGIESTKRFDSLAHCQAFADKINPSLQNSEKRKRTAYCAEGIVEELPPGPPSEPARRPGY